MVKYQDEPYKTLVDKPYHAKTSCSDKSTRLGQYPDQPIQESLGTCFYGVKYFDFHSDLQ